MSTLENSIRLKTNAAKGPVVTGLMPSNPPEHGPSSQSKNSVATSKSLKNNAAVADSQFAEKVRQVNSKLQTPGVKLSTPGVASVDKTVNRF